MRLKDILKQLDLLNAELWQAKIRLTSRQFKMQLQWSQATNNIASNYNRIENRPCYFSSLLSQATVKMKEQNCTLLFCTFWFFYPMLPWVFHWYNQHTYPKRYFKTVFIYVGCNVCSSNFTFVALSIFCLWPKQKSVFDVIHYHYYLHLKSLANSIYWRILLQHFSISRLFHNNDNCMNRTGFKLTSSGIKHISK